MIGILLGDILWEIMGDKKARLILLFGTNLLYSISIFITTDGQSVDRYSYARFFAGIGLAVDLGAGITLVSELLPNQKRGIGVSMVVGIGLFGAVLAYFIYEWNKD